MPSPADLQATLSALAEHIARACPEAYFVGGCVRDLLRSDPIKDVDLTVRGDTYALGKSLAKAFRGHVFWLHQDEQVARVALPELGGLQVDLVPLKDTLEADLLGRDLTINALAIPVEQGLVTGATVVDLCGGKDDLADGVIRFVTPSAPESDPLRCLRALRFRWKLGFSLHPETDAALRACAPLLERVSVERIRDELFQLLALGNADEALQECCDYGLWRWLTGNTLPPPAREGQCVPASRVRDTLALIDRPGPELDRLLSTELTPPRGRRELLLWAAALQATGIAPGRGARYLALSNDERQVLTHSLDGALAVAELALRWPASGRARFRVLSAARPAGPEAVLLAGLGDRPDVLVSLLDEALRRHFWPQPPLVSGLEVMQLLDLKPGPQIGVILQDVEEARADGLIRTSDDAVVYLRERRNLG